MTVADPVRVLQFLPVFKSGGTERHVANLVAGLDRARFDVHIGCILRVGELLPEIEARGIPITDYPVHRLYGAHTFRQQIKLARYLRQHRIDIVHSYNFHGNCVAIPAARLARTSVIVASIRDIGAFLTPHQKRVHRMACRLASVVLVNADAIRQWLIGEGYSASRIITIRNGIDLARFVRPSVGAGIREELGLSREAPVIAVFTRINRLKGLEYFLEAASAIALHFPEARFLVVGDFSIVKNGVLFPKSDYHRELEGHVVRLGLEGRVVFTGFRPDVAELLSEATLSVLPSLSEGLSNAVLESMAAGVPVVATRVGGIPEAVTDGVTGLLVPPRDSAALAEAMCRFLDDPDLARRVGRAGRAHVAGSFSLKDMVRQTQDFYLSLLNRNAVRPGLAVESA